jgi:hypothetical protein
MLGAPDSFKPRMRRWVQRTTADEKLGRELVNRGLATR